MEEKGMEKNVICVLMMALIFSGIFNMAFMIRLSFANKNGDEFLDNHFSQMAEEPVLYSDIDASCRSRNFNGALERIFERKPDGTQQDGTFEDCARNSRDVRVNWNLNDSEWSKFAYVNDDKTRLIVGVKDEGYTSLLQLEGIVAKHQAEIVKKILIKGRVEAFVVELPFIKATRFIEETRKTGLASYIEPNMKVQAQLIPNDPYWSMQWGPQKIGADWAWNTTVGSSAVLVAVVDTGIYYYHEDLAPNYVALGYDWVNMDADPLDDHGHGTHCAGIIAAVLNNGIGIAGLSQVRIMAEKVLDSWGYGYADWVANGIIHAVDSGAQVISMSLGGYGYSELLHEAVKYAYEKGVLLIGAAGNDNTNMKLYPAGFEEVIAVAATDQYDYKAWFSNWGDWIELAAPGVDIYSTFPWGYKSSSGTSMACPHVSGVAALVWSLYPNRTSDWIRLWLRYTADDLGDLGFDVYFGYGRINAKKAVEIAPPEHELIAYEWATPPYVEPGTVGIIKVKILNFGENNETGITAQLIANGTIVDFASIDFLAASSSVTASLFWNPTIEGLYNITFYLTPVPGEINFENNVLWKYIYVGFPVKAVVLHSAGNVFSDIIVNWQVLNNEWQLFGDTMVCIDYTTLNKENITYEDIAATEADVLIISCAYNPYAGWEFTDSEIEAITRYIYEGHGLMATAGTFYYYVPNNNKLASLFGLRENIIWYATTTDLLHLMNVSHPLFINVPNPLVFPRVRTALPSDRSWDPNELIDGKYLALGHFRESAIVMRRGLIYISPWLEVIPAYYHHHLQLLYNSIIWSRYQKPQHELVISLEAPRALKPSRSALLNVTVFNMGLCNETDVELQLLINGVIKNSTNVPELLVGDSYTVSYLWSPTAEGIYNVTAYAPPVHGEEIILNNVKSLNVLVSTLSVALFQNYNSWNYPANQEALDRYDVPYVIFKSRDFGKVDLSVFTKVVIASDQDQAFYNGMDTYRWWFEDYVNQGGILEIHAADGGWHGGWWIGPLPGGLDWVSYPSQYVTVVDPTHDLLTKPNLITEAELDNWNYAVHGYFRTYPADAHVIIIEDFTGKPAYLEFNYGLGFIIASSQTLEWAYRHRVSLILENSLLYMPKRYEHDLAVTLGAPKFLEPGSSVLMNVTVYNRGLSSETDVELQLLINGTLVESVLIPVLLNGASYTLSYLWSPTVEALYNVTAYVPPLPGEEFTRNNVASAFVKVCYVIARVAILNSWDMPPYFIGGWGNDYRTLVDALDARGFYAQPVTNVEIINGGLSFFDVFVMVDNVPNQAAVPYVVDFWLNGGGIVSFDSSICFLCYAGILPPESAGHNGYYIYWDYETKYQARVCAAHPITMGYEIGQIIYGQSGDAEYRVEALTHTRAYPYYTMLVEDVGRPNRAYVIAYAPPFTGRAVHFWDQNHWNNVNLQLMILNAIKWAKAPRYEHDIAVSLDAPRNLPPGAGTVLNATVYNMGLSSETNVTLQLIINGTIVVSEVIQELARNKFYTLSYPWTPSAEGIYNVTVYAPPLTGEEYIENNVKKQIVNVQSVMVALISDHVELTAITYILDSMRINYDVYNNNDMYLYTADLSLLLNYRVVIFYTDYRWITPEEQTALNSYLSLGGNLIVTGFDCLIGDTRLADVVRSATVGDNAKRPNLFVYMETHPIMNGPYGSFPRGYCVTDLFSDCDLAKADVARGAIAVAGLGDGYDKIIATEMLPGKVVFWNGKGDYDWTWNLDCQAMFMNMVHWMIAVAYKHDLSVSLHAPKILEPGQPAWLLVTVTNLGLSEETDVELQLWINNSIVKSETIPVLAAGLSFTFDYLWIPPLKGIYNITACSPPVLGEENVTNNVATQFVSVVQIYQTRLVVVPYLTVVLPHQRFTVKINISNVEKMVAWQISIKFDPTILECLNVSIPPDNIFAGKIIIAPDPLINNSEGIVFYGATIMPMVGVSGNGILCEIQFKGKTKGISPLEFIPTMPFRTLLIDQEENEISFIPLSGFVNVVEELPPKTDIAITFVKTSPIAVYPKRIVKITVVAENLGEEYATFNVSIYCNTTLIETRRIFDLPPHENITLTFTWNTSSLTPGQKFIIRAEAAPLPGETNLENNILINGIVKIKFLGDVNGDDVVDMKDIADLIRAFGTKPDYQRWNPEGDLNNDGVIDLKDVKLALHNYGKNAN